MFAKPIVDESRLILPTDIAAGQWDDDGPKFRLETHGEPVLLVDPNQVARGVFDAYPDADSKYVQTHGVVFCAFGGVVSGPVFRQGKYLMIPSGMCRTVRDAPPRDAEILVPEAFTDSGAYVFLPLAADLPAAVKADAEKVVKQRNGWILPFAAGRYSFHYEQHEPEHPDEIEFFRNIVVRRE